MPDIELPRPRTCAARADPTRLAIVERLLAGEATVAELAQPFPLSQPAISRRLKAPDKAGLIETRVAGTSRPRRLRPEAIEALWTRLDRTRRAMEAKDVRLDTRLAQMQAENRKD